MLVYGCLWCYWSLNTVAYLKTFKKFSLGAELQPQRASPTMSFTQTCRFWRRVKVEGGGVALSSLRPRYHELVFTVDVIVMARIHTIIRRRTQILAVFCKYSKTRVLRRESWSSISK
jgi:hypothetical protein